MRVGMVRGSALSGRAPAEKIQAQDPECAPRPSCLHSQSSSSRRHPIAMSQDTERQAEATRQDPRWAQLLARDPAAEGQFYYAVTSTGVYCRPTCGARAPRPEHVRFFLTGEAASQAGFRPCRRCKPEQPPLAVQHAGRIAGLCRLIEAAETPPSLAWLAKQAGMSPHHLHRVFKAVTGVTPHAYAQALRAARVREALGQHARVSDALYQAGYQSSGHFYQTSSQLLGMTPSRYQAGGVAEQLRFAVGHCSLGAILVAASARGVCAILLGDDPDALVRNLQARFPQAGLVGGDAGFEQWMAQVVGLVDCPKVGLDLPLDIRGTAFQQRVWQALREIPPGVTTSYGELAQRIGAPRAVRAVAGACAANALAVAIPCHRVVRHDGSVSGYRWGVARKHALLAREAQQKEAPDD